MFCIWFAPSSGQLDTTLRYVWHKNSLNLRGDMLDINQCKIDSNATGSKLHTQQKHPSRKVTGMYKQGK